MKQLLIATHNLNKLAEFKALLKGINYKIVGLADLGIIEEVKEDQDSYQGNALLKAKHYAKLSGLVTLSDDSGLEVEALNFMPGIYSARFLGKTTSYTDKNKVIISKVKQNRAARYVCALALVFPKSKPVLVEAILHGKISEVELGNNGFGYDPIFIPDGQEKTFAQMSNTLKNKLSHRAKAVALIRHLLK
jgi:XTP/dITP diphosphohydrolase